MWLIGGWEGRRYSEKPLKKEVRVFVLEWPWFCLFLGVFCIPRRHLASSVFTWVSLRGFLSLSTQDDDFRMMCVCLGAQARNLGILAFSVLLKPEYVKRGRNLDRLWGIPVFKERKKNFKGKWELEVGEAGMHPKASLKWKEGVVKCHQILNWIAFVFVRSSSKWWENKYPFGNVVTQNWKLQKEHWDEGTHKPPSSGSQGDSSINTNYKIHTRTRNEWWVISIRSDFELLKVKACVLFTNIFAVTSLDADISFHKFLLHI